MTSIYYWLTPMQTIISYENLFHNRIKYGWKVAWIAWLYINNYTIPKGFILPCDSIYFDESICIWDKNEIKFPWICRSSVECEDGHYASFAWIFHSKVIYRQEELHWAINEIRQSSKTEYAQKYAKIVNVKIWSVHILIQEYIEWEISWVYFSDLFGKWPLIEYVEWSCSKLVNSQSNAKKAWYRDLLDNKINYPNILRILFWECNSIATLYWKDVDIEWTVQENQIYFLQIRPITQEICR